MQRELDTGTLTLEEAEVHPQRNVLLQAVGSQATLAPAFSTYTLQPGDAFAVCCDGFYRNSSEGEIRDVLDACRRAPDAQLEGLLQQALRRRIERGERDNITVCCLLEGAPGDDDALTSVLAAEGARGDDATSVLPAAGADDAPTGVLGRSAHVPDDAPTGVLGADDGATTTLAGGA